MKSISKKAKNIGLALLLIISLIMTFIPASLADDYEPQAGGEASFSPSTSAVEVGDDFTVTFYLDTGGDTTTGFTIRQLLFNTTSVGLANIIPNPAGTPGESYNISFAPTWYDGTFNDDGDLDNSTGNLTYIIANKLGGITGNNSAMLINFTALKSGVLEIRIPYTIWSGQAGLAIDGVVPDTWTNTSIIIHPANPTGFTATAYNHTAINLSWNTPTNSDDNTTVCGKEGSYPSGPTDNLLYNGSNLTYNHTALTNCTTYYYRAWSYNVTSGLHSFLNDSETATTTCYTNISFKGIVPTNGSTTVNCTYDIPVNVTIRNSMGKLLNTWINCSDGTSEGGTGGAANQSYSVTMNGLSHNTQYWWNVTAWESLNPTDCLKASYTFTTGQGGGTSPSATVPYPKSGNTSLPVNDIHFSVIVTDPDGDDVNTTFYWANHSVIGYQNFTASGGRVWVNITPSLSYNTTYSWYVSTRDACGARASSTYTFTTDEALLAATKEWTVHTNNTIEAWINITNVGEANIQNAYINDTYDSDTTFVGSSPANDAGDTGEWTIPWINTTGANQWYNVTVWLALAGPLANGTTITNNGTINHAVTNTFSASTLTMCFWATKEANMTSLDSNTSSVNYTINITNCGDFYLNWVQVNETYSANLSYSSSSPAGFGAHTTFNITQVAPGTVGSMWIIMDTTFGAGGGILDNGTIVWNNITVDSNETSVAYARTSRLYVGARTSLLRVIYTTIYYDMISLSNSLFGILGILLIISTIMVIVGLVYYNKGGLGGGGGLGGEGDWRG